MRRTLALILTATATLTALTAGAVDRPAHAASFTVYFANDESESAADIEQYGASDSATVYDDWSLSCSTTGCSNVPS